MRKRAARRPGCVLAYVEDAVLRARVLHELRRVESADRVGVRHSRRHHLQTAQCRGQGRRSTIRFCLLLRSSLAQGHRAGSDGFSAGPDGGCGLCSAVRRMALLRPHVPVYSPPQWDLFCGFSVKFPGVPVAGQCAGCHGCCKWIVAFCVAQSLLHLAFSMLHLVLHVALCCCCLLCCMRCGMSVGMPCDHRSSRP